MFHHEDHCQGRDQKGTPANVRFWHEADIFRFSGNVSL